MTKEETKTDAAEDVEENYGNFRNTYNACCNRGADSTGSKDKLRVYANQQKKLERLIKWQRVRALLLLVLVASNIIIGLLWV